MRIALSKATVTYGASGRTIEQVAVLTRDGVIEVRDRTGALIDTLTATDVARPLGEQWVLTLADGSTVTVQRQLGGCGCGR